MPQQLRKMTLDCASCRPAQQILNGGLQKAKLSPTCRTCSKMFLRAQKYPEPNKVKFKVSVISSSHQAVRITICDCETQDLPSESHSVMARVPAPLPLVLGPVSLPSPPLYTPTYASLFRMGSRPLGTPTAEHRVLSETLAVCFPPGLVAHCNMMPQDASGSSLFTGHIFMEHPWMPRPI